MTELNAIANRDDWSKVYSLAESYQQQQQWQLAAEAFQRAIQLRPDFFWSYHHLGDILTQLQQWRQASLAYSHAVKLDPNFFWSWHNLGDVLTKLQQWQQASLAYSRAVEINPGFFWSWHNLGDALTKLQQWDKAIAIYLQAIQLQPENQQVYQKIGTAFKQRGSLEESIRYYRQLIQSTQHSIYGNLSTKPEILLTIADTLAIEHQIEAAIALYYMMLEIQPHQTQILLKLAELLQQRDRLQQSITSRQQALQSELLTRQTINTNTAAKPKSNNIPGQVTVKINAPILPDSLEELCSQVGWSSRPLDRVKQSLANSFCHVSAWHSTNEQQQLIGFARAISDAAFHAVLLDVLVHPHFQNKGVGKKVVRALIEQLQQAKVKDITLLASPHVFDFYHKLGFIAQPGNLQWMLLCNS